MADKFAVSAMSSGYLSFKTPITDGSTFSPTVHQINIPEGMINIGGNGKGYAINASTFDFTPLTTLSDGTYTIFAIPPTDGTGIVTLDYDSFNTYLTNGGDSDDKRSVCYFRVFDGLITPSSILTFTFGISIPDDVDNPGTGKFYSEFYTLLEKAGVYPNSTDDFGFNYQGQFFDENAVFGTDTADGKNVVTAGETALVFIHTDGKYYKAEIDTGNPTYSEVVGMSRDVILPSGSGSEPIGTVVFNGFIADDTSAFSEGAVVYLDDTNPGSGTAGEYSTTASVREIGIVIKADTVENGGYLLLKQRTIETADVANILLGFAGLTGYDKVIGSSAEVSGGVATHTESTYIAALNPGDRVYKLAGTHGMTSNSDVNVENVKIYFDPEAILFNNNQSSAATVYTMTYSGNGIEVFSANYSGFGANEIIVSGDGCHITTTTGTTDMFNVTGVSTVRASDGLIVPDGSVSFPSISVGSDNSSGIYSSGTNIFDIGTAGANALTINASQEVTFSAIATFGSSLDTNSFIDISSAGALLIGPTTATSVVINGGVTIVGAAISAVTTIGMSGNLTISGDITGDSGNLTVSSSTGNTLIESVTFNSGAISTISSIDLNGSMTIEGNITGDSGNLTVSSSSGNTLIESVIFNSDAITGVLSIDGSGTLSIGTSTATSVVIGGVTFGGTGLDEISGVESINVNSMTVSGVDGPGTVSIGTVTATDVVIDDVTFTGSTITGISTLGMSSDLTISGNITGDSGNLTVSSSTGNTLIESVIFNSDVITGVDTITTSGLGTFGGSINTDSFLDITTPGALLIGPSTATSVVIGGVTFAGSGMDDITGVADLTVDGNIVGATFSSNVSWKLITSGSDITAGASGENVLLCSGTAQTITLNTADRSGLFYYIKKTSSSGTITITSSDTIDGSGSGLILNTQYQSVLLGTDGTNWFIL